MEYTAFRDAEGHWVSAEFVDDGIDVRTGQKLEAVKLKEDEVEKQGDSFVLRAHPEIRVEARAYKMSKSRGNVVNPDDVVEQYGADSLRLYEMFMGPLEQVKPWSMRGVEGVHRFLNRVWRLYVSDADGSLRVTDGEPTREQLRVLHQTLRRVTDDIEAMRFNTAIAAMMEFVNAANRWETFPRAVAEPFVLMLSPFAPHIAEELWERLGHTESLAYEPWPEVNEEYLKVDEVEIAVQVNGKVRATVRIPAEADQETALAIARQHENVARYIDGKPIRRAIYVPGRIINFVVG
nr:class I tRNA ligase family protein [Rhodothermus marinus]